MVLRLGGVYADVDTECKSPLNDLILPRDTLVVSWENEFSTAEEAHQRKYVRKRQVGPCLKAAAYSMLPAVLPSPLGVNTTFSIAGTARE